MIDSSTLPDPAASPEATLEAVLSAAADRVLRGGGGAGDDPVAEVIAITRREAAAALTALGLGEADLRIRAEAALRRQIGG